MGRRQKNAVLTRKGSDHVSDEDRFEQRGEKRTEPHIRLGRMFQAERRASIKPLKGECTWSTGGTQRGQFGWSKMSGEE